MKYSGPPVTAAP